MEYEISAIVVEDSKLQQSAIKFILQEVEPNLRIIGNATKLSEVEDLIGRLHPMVLILNISDESEIKIATELLIRNDASEGFKFQTIIFCAPGGEIHYSEVVNSGLVHFLTLPIDKKKLMEKIDYISKSVLLHKLDQLELLVSQIQEKRHKSALPDWIVVEGLDFNEFINTKDIVYMEASGRNTYFYMNTAESQPICASVNLSEYAKKLKYNPRFFRIHRNKIINLDFLLRFTRKDRFVVLYPPYGNQFASKYRLSELHKHIEKMKYQDGASELMRIR